MRTAATRPHPLSIMGGLVGHNYGYIDQSVFNGSAYGTNVMGGLVGVNESTGSNPERSTLDSLYAAQLSSTPTSPTT